MSARSRGRPSDRGSLSIEFAIVMGAVMVTFVVLMISAGRILQQENDVRSAAHAAARAASLRDHYGDGLADAKRVADQNLSDSGVSCVGGGSTTITSGAGNFEPGGHVTVRVDCSARIIGTLGLGPLHPYHYEATEVIDVYRGSP